MHETIPTNIHGIAHWSVIKHAEQYKDLIIQTRPKSSVTTKYLWRFIWHIEKIHT